MVRIALAGIAIVAAAAGADEPAPSTRQQHEFMAAVRQSAAEYVRSLPDYICTETIQREQDLREPDTLTVQLSNYQGREQYLLTAIDGRPAKIAYDAIEGPTAYGEFGSILKILLGQRSATEFRFRKWTSVRDRPAVLYSYRLARAASEYQLSYVMAAKSRHEKVGLSGEIVFDRKTYAVLRLIYQAEGIPGSFPIRQSEVQVDYDYADIAGRRYLLPALADMRVKTRNSGAARFSRSVIYYSNYRRFSTDSTVIYDKQAEKP